MSQLINGEAMVLSLENTRSHKKKVLEVLILKLYTMIHQLKSWLITSYSWIRPFNVNRYLDAFCY